MNEINWRRFLAFLPVSLALGWIGPYLFSHFGNAGVAIGAILFFTFFIPFYSLPRWGKPLLPAATTRRLLWVGIITVALVCFSLTSVFRHAPLWLTLLAYLMACILVFLRA